MLMEQADFIVKPDYSCKVLATGESSRTLEESKCHTCLQEGKKEDLGNYRMFSCNLIPRNVIEQIILETISRPLKDRKVDWV